MLATPREKSQKDEGLKIKSHLVRQARHPADPSPYGTPQRKRTLTQNRWGD